jgi:plasmid maintenance system antidote protein VapI
MKNKELRLRIFELFDYQAYFAEAVGMDESKVSRILQGRKKLRSDESENWQKVLGCDFEVVKPVTKSVDTGS